MHHDVEDYVIKYHQYQVNKAQHLKSRGLLHPTNIPNEKCENISMDLIVILMLGT